MADAPDAFVYNATLERIVDGDTFDCSLDLGFDVKLHKQRVRLAEIDTPESRTRDLEEKERGLAAKANVKQLISENKNKFVLHSQGVGKFGRCLGEIYLGDSKLNDILINEGHAVAYYGGKR